ncbi:MAG: sigma-70 factor domain-containing protein [Chloroflexota bacterium]
MGGLTRQSGPSRIPATAGRAAECGPLNWSTVISFDSPTPASETEAALAAASIELDPEAAELEADALVADLPVEPEPVPTAAEEAEADTSTEVLDTDDSVRLYLREIGRVPLTHRGGGGHPRQGHGARRAGQGGALEGPPLDPRVVAAHHRGHRPGEEPQVHPAVPGRGASRRQRCPALG